MWGCWLPLVVRSRAQGASTAPRAQRWSPRRADPRELSCSSRVPPTGHRLPQPLPAGCQARGAQGPPPRPTWTAGAAPKATRGLASQGRSPGLGIPVCSCTGGSGTCSEVSPHRGHGPAVAATTAGRRSSHPSCARRFLWAGAGRATGPGTEREQKEGPHQKHQALHRWAC